MEVWGWIASSLRSSQRRMGNGGEKDGFWKKFGV
jgi:hypothetical protein